MATSSPTPAAELLSESARLAEQAALLQDADARAKVEAALKQVRAVSEATARQLAAEERERERQRLARVDALTAKHAAHVEAINGRGAAIIDAADKFGDLERQAAELWQGITANLDANTNDVRALDTLATEIRALGGEVPRASYAGEYALPLTSQKGHVATDHAARAMKRAAAKGGGRSVLGDIAGRMGLVKV